MKIMWLQTKLNKAGKIMKNKTKFIVICMMIILCPMFKVHADSGEYLIKFQEGYHPNIYEYNLKEVNADRGIYLANNLEDLKPDNLYVNNDIVNNLEDVATQEISTYSPYHKYLVVLPAFAFVFTFLLFAYIFIILFTT